MKENRLSRHQMGFCNPNLWGAKRYFAPLLSKVEGRGDHTPAPGSYVFGVCGKCVWRWEGAGGRMWGGGGGRITRAYLALFVNTNPLLYIKYNYSQSGNTSRTEAQVINYCSYSSTNEAILSLQVKQQVRALPGAG